MDSKLESLQFTALLDNFFNVGEPGGSRHDPGDMGGEYRSFIGLPGGMKSPLYALVTASNKKAGNYIKLVEGKGSEPDADKVAWIYDSNEFPFYRAEQYHQFHVS